MLYLVLIVWKNPTKGTPLNLLKCVDSKTDNKYAKRICTRNKEKIKHIVFYSLCGRRCCCPHCYHHHHLSHPHPNLTRHLQYFIVMYIKTEHTHF